MTSLTWFYDANWLPDFILASSALLLSSPSSLVLFHYFSFFITSVLLRGIFCLFFSASSFPFFFLVFVFCFFCYFFFFFFIFFSFYDFFWFFLFLISHSSSLRSHCSIQCRLLLLFIKLSYQFAFCVRIRIHGNWSRLHLSVFSCYRPLICNRFITFVFTSMWWSCYNSVTFLPG